MFTKQRLALLFCTPGYRHSTPHFHLCGSRSICNQRKLPTRGGDAGFRCSWAHCAQDELSTNQDLLRGRTPPTTPALLTWTLCKYLEQTITFQKSCQYMLFENMPLVQTGHGSSAVMPLNVDVTKNSVSVFSFYYHTSKWFVPLFLNMLICILPRDIWHCLGNLKLQPEQRDGLAQHKESKWGETASLALKIRKEIHSSSISGHYLSVRPCSSIIWV